MDTQNTIPNGKLAFWLAFFAIPLFSRIGIAGHASSSGAVVSSNQEWQVDWSGGEVWLSLVGCRGGGCTTFCRSPEAKNGCSKEGINERRRIAGLLFVMGPHQKKCVEERVGLKDFALASRARYLDLDKLSVAMMACGREDGEISSRAANRLHDRKQTAQFILGLDRPKKRCLLDRVGRVDFDLAVKAELVDFEKLHPALEACAGGMPGGLRKERPTAKVIGSGNPWQSAPEGCRDTATCEATCLDPDNFDKCLAWPHLPGIFRQMIEEKKRELQED